MFTAYCSLFARFPCELRRFSAVSVWMHYKWTSPRVYPVSTISPSRSCFSVFVEYPVVFNLQSKLKVVYSVQSWSGDVLFWYLCVRIMTVGFGCFMLSVVTRMCEYLKCVSSSLCVPCTFHETLNSRLLSFIRHRDGLSSVNPFRRKWFLLSLIIL